MTLRDKIRSVIFKKPTDLRQDGWTYYDTYKTIGQAKYYEKVLKRANKKTLITESEYEDKLYFKLWYKE